jgi:hypothetical protein
MEALNTPLARERLGRNRSSVLGATLPRSRFDKVTGRGVPHPRAPFRHSGARTGARANGSASPAPGRPTPRPIGRDRDALGRS